MDLFNLPPKKKKWKGNITVPARDLSKSPAVRTDGKFCKSLHSSPKNVNL